MSVTSQTHPCNTAEQLVIKTHLHSSGQKNSNNHLHTHSAWAHLTVELRAGTGLATDVLASGVTQVGDANNRMVPWASLAPLEKLTCSLRRLRIMYGTFSFVYPRAKRRTYHDSPSRESSVASAWSTLAILRFHASTCKQNEIHICQFMYGYYSHHIEFN